MPDLDVFVTGGIGVDHIVKVPSLPVLVADSVMTPPIQTVVGHAGNGVAMGCAALGLATAICDVIGDDPEGDLIRRHCTEAGVGLKVATDPSGTRRSVNLVAPGGARTSLYDPRHPYDLLPDESLWRDGVAKARLTHVVIVNWARHALRQAVGLGRLTSTDLQDWDGLNPHHREFAELADIVFCSAANLADPAATARGILSYGRARVVVVTDGANGSTAHPRGAAAFHVPAVTLPGRPPVDSNGAGDAYAAAFLARVLAGDSWARAAEAASVAGAWAVGSAGTHTDLITAEALASLSASEAVRRACGWDDGADR
ncbi:MAG: carbohydrate kinase family protein [Propionibacteriaceae bacterium]|nr:carbohydrate kinase family protein [Propionibacteriaceae bacterium]